MSDHFEFPPYDEWLYNWLDDGGLFDGGDNYLLELFEEAAAASEGRDVYNNYRALFIWENALAEFKRTLLAAVMGDHEGDDD